MPNYFEHFKTTAYTLANNNVSLDKVTNIMRTFSFDSSFKDNASVFYEYDILDGETPEIVSDKMYGSPDFHWIILNYNQILHPQFDWVLDSTSFINFVDKKYEEYADTANNETGLAWAQTNIKDYSIVEKKINLLTDEFTEDIIYIDSNTYANTINSSEVYTLKDGTNFEIKQTKNTTTYYEYEESLNESKRSIKILKPEFIPSVFEEFKSII
ncbi:MAG: baseplate wedge protein 53 [Sediminibacterium sp.]